MNGEERSGGALWMCLAALALLGAAFLLPWFSHDSSSGRRTAPGGLADPDDPQVERHEVDYLAFRFGGDVSPDQREDAERDVLWIGVGVSVAAVAAGVVALAEVPRRWRLLRREAVLSLLGLAAALLIAALAVAWFLLPGTLDGTDGPFSYRKLPDGYERTTLGLGWAAAALAVPALLGAFAFKFQAGAHDPAIVEAYAKRT